MPEEDEIRTELMGLLRYANATAVGKALGVSSQTVTNWAHGKHPSQRRLDQVRALYGLPVGSQGEQKEAAPPAWAERLAVESADAVVRRLVPPELLGAAHRLLADLARLAPPSDEAGDAMLEGHDQVG